LRTSFAFPKIVQPRLSRSIDTSTFITPFIIWISSIVGRLSGQPTHDIVTEM
jgi:hypothetical protein